MAGAKPRSASEDLSSVHVQDPFQEFVSGIIEAIPCAVSVKLAGDLSYIVVNKAARDLLGPDAGVVGLTDANLFPAARARRIQADDASIIASGAAGPVIEAELDTTQGRRTLCTQKFPVFGVGGAPDVLVTYSEDVTPQARLVAASEMWEEVFSHSARGIVIGQADGTTLELMNPAFALLFGFTMEELSGRSLLDIFEPSAHKTIIAMWDLVRVHGQHRFETLCRRKDGTTFPAVVEATSATDAEGNVHYRVIRIQDVSLLSSQERAMRDDRDEARRANTAKSLFVAGLSHELRTPLNVILGFAQVMQLDDLTAVQAESVSHILQAGKHLLNIIDEALDIASVEAGRISLTLEPVRVSSIVRSVLQLMQPLGDAAGIRLVNESKNSRLCAVADKHRLQQVLLNLTTNAINYNVPGGEVRFRIGRQARKVNISVVDSGLGIPEGRSHRLFVPFDRLGREATEIEGTGLGLSLSKGLAEAMGGTIVAAPNAGPGTTFTVTLVESPSPSHGVRESASASPWQGAEKQQVLFIEDSLASIQLIEEVLRLRPGLRVLTAMQAGIGLQLARHHQPDLIVLDAYLPDLTGEETILRLSKDPRTSAIPVIMASAEARARQDKVPLKRRARAHLTKPIEISALLQAIDAVLGAGDNPVAAGEVQATRT